MIATFTQQEEPGDPVDETHNPFQAQRSTHPGIIPCLFPHPHLPNITVTSLSRQEETGAAVDETHNPFLAEEGDPLLAKREQEMQKRMTRRDGTVMSLAQVGQKVVGGVVWLGRVSGMCAGGRCRDALRAGAAPSCPWRTVGGLGLEPSALHGASRTDGMGG